jgi:aryl-alcohol dehydrogenase-like predicted oxidoreductase
MRHPGYDAAQMAEFTRIRPVETLQPPYHLFRRDGRGRSAALRTVFEGETFGATSRSSANWSALPSMSSAPRSTQLAVAWTLANPAVHVAIVGARSPGRVQEGVAAAQLRLSEGDLEQIDRIMARSVAIAGPFPRWAV